MSLKTKVFVTVYNSWNPQGRTNSTVKDVAFMWFAMRFDRSIVFRINIFAAIEMKET